jgi:hypothetical protein
VVGDGGGVVETAGVHGAVLPGDVDRGLVPKPRLTITEVAEFELALAHLDVPELV